MAVLAGFRREVYNEIKSIFNEQNVVLHVIGWDKDGCLVGIADTLSTLGGLLLSDSTVGLVADFTINGNLGYDLVNERKVSEEQLTNLSKSNLNEYIVSEVVNESKTSKISPKDLVNSSNKLVASLHMYIGNNTGSHITSSIGVLNPFKDIVGVAKYETLELFTDGVAISITGSQVSLLTSIGVVKVHGTNKDIDFEELLDLLSKLTRINSSILREVFLDSE